MVELTADVLYHLSAYLDDCDLRNFSLVNRLFHEISSTYLYKTIVIKFSSPDILDIAVARWSRILESTNGFKYVRHVKVLARCLEDYRGEGDDDFNDCGDDPRASWKYCFVKTFDDWDGLRGFLGNAQVLLTRDSQWDDLNRFMNRLPNLQELTWGCEEQIPASIFSCASRNHPGLRLHMRNFKLHSLSKLAEEPSNPALSAFEIELATAPCLYSLAMWHRNDFTYDVENVIMDMLAGAAPNLRELELYSHTSVFRRLKHKYQRGSRLPIPSPGLGSLRHLGLHTKQQLIAVRNYSSVTDFSRLESLEIHDAVGAEMLQWLASLQLSALEHLSSSSTNPRCDGRYTIAEAVPDSDFVRFTKYKNGWTFRRTHTPSGT
jgi:hypothetical protein